MFEFQRYIRQIQMWPLQLKQLLIYRLAKASDEWTARRTDGRTDRQKTIISEAEDKYKIRSDLFWSDLNINLILAIFSAATGSKVTFYLGL